MDEVKDLAMNAYEALSFKHKAFVTAYCTNWNAAAAARAAGYATRRAKGTGWDLLQRPDVRAAIEERRKKNELDVVGNTLTQMLQARMQDYMREGEDGRPQLDFEKLRRDEVTIISELMVESRSGGAARGGPANPPSEIVKTRFRVSDKLRAEKPERVAQDGRGGPSPMTPVSDYDRLKAVLALLVKVKKRETNNGVDEETFWSSLVQDLRSMT
jgi:hypothetical protein